MLQGGKAGTERARKLRREMSLPEVSLWQQLKTRPNGLKFRKQHPSGPFVADFYCHEKRLIVEVDGIVHDMRSNPERDMQRDAWFAERNLRVLRIPAKEVLNDATAVAQSIVDYTNSKSSH